MELLEPSNNKLSKTIVSETLYNTLNSLNCKGLHNISIGLDKLSDEDMDDNDSLCSSQSSTSEHSITNKIIEKPVDNSLITKKKIKKIRNPKCPIHMSIKSINGNSNEESLKYLKNPNLEDSKKNTLNLLKTNQISEENSKTKTGNLKCICIKRLSKSGKYKEINNNVTEEAMLSSRPDPEGEIDDISSLNKIENLENLFISDEALFSDLEDDPIIDEELKKETERFQKRIEKRGGQIENIFSSSQMLNTNSMIKFAILQTELKNIKDRSLKQIEADINSTLNRLDIMQKTCDESSTDLNNFSQNLQKASQIIDKISDKTIEDNKFCFSNFNLISFKYKMITCAPDIYFAKLHLNKLTRKANLLENEIKSSTSKMNNVDQIKNTYLQIMNEIFQMEKTILKWKNSI